MEGFRLKQAPVSTHAGAEKGIAGRRIGVQSWVRSSWMAPVLGGCNVPLVSSIFLNHLG